MRTLVAIGCLILAGCTTVAPKIVQPTATTQTVTKVSGGYLISPTQRQKYNDLIGLGYGKADHHFLPELKKDDGVTVHADGSIFMSDEAAVNFEAMNLLFRSGIKP